MAGPRMKLITRAKMAAAALLKVIYWKIFKGENVSFNEYRK